MWVFDAALSTLQDFIGDNLAEKATDTAAAAMDRKELMERVQDLAERYRPQFEAVSLKEEFDFEGLNNFLQENLFPRVAACFNAPGHDQQEAAKRLLFAYACDHAGANTQAKKDAVRRYLELFLAVVEGFFLEHVDGQTWFLCGRAVAEVDKLVKAYLQQQKDQIIEAIRYHNSFAEYIDNLQPPVTTTNRFHYRNAKLRFYGREQETAALNAFLNRNEQILWMAVVGDGGVGKSKLLYHFCDQTSNRPGWKTVWFGKNSSKKVNDYQNWHYPGGLLVVADYAGEIAEQLGDWLANLAETGENRCPKKLRLILLERENLGEAVTPFWYQTFTGGRERSRAVKQFQAKPTSIELPGLGDEALGALVQDYARSEKGRELTQTELSSVLEKAHEIDRDNPAPRPLVTLFIADAVLEGNDYTHWDIPALVENIIERYQDHWRNTVCNGDEKLYDALQQVLVYATAVGGWDLTELPEPLEAASKTLLASGWVLEPLVCAVNEENTFRERLSPLEPDLVGEFYVLDYLNDLRYDKSRLAAWVQLFWEDEENFGYFLERCIENYCNEKRFQALFRDGMVVFQPRAEDMSEVVLFAMLLAKLTYWQPLNERKVTVSKLKALAEQHPRSDDISFTYAAGLFFLTAEQSLEDKTRAVAELETMQYLQSVKIAIMYANALLVLFRDQLTDEAAQTIAKLRALTEKYPYSAEIAHAYATALVRHPDEQSLKDVVQVVDKLEKLLTDLNTWHSSSEEIAGLYALELVKLSFLQPVETAVQSTAKLKTLVNLYPNSVDIAVAYAGGLCNVSFDQSLENATQAVATLGELANNHSDSDTIAHLYAIAQDWLAAKKKL
ncbi:MAG: hypothetical protein LUE89_03610 [Clostridiales bacterium]|nr:hypothetical protein [Clostridiales bacterium]